MPRLSASLLGRTQGDGYWTSWKVVSALCDECAGTIAFEFSKNSCSSTALLSVSSNGRYEHHFENRAVLSSNHQTTCQTTWFTYQSYKPFKFSSRLTITLAQADLYFLKTVELRFHTCEACAGCLIKPSWREIQSWTMRHGSSRDQRVWCNDLVIWKFKLGLHNPSCKVQTYLMVGPIRAKQINKRNELLLTVICC